MKSVLKHNTIQRFFLSSLTFILLFSMQLSAQGGDAKKGKGIFNANCAACHKLDKKSIGPALKGISERRTKEWLHAWIRDNNALRASGDADAIAVFEEFNKIPMSAFQQLSDQDIDDIIAYTDDKPQESKADGGAVAGVPEGVDINQVKKGKGVFNANCAACHKLDSKSIGPALANVADRRSKEWLHAWIKDNNALRASGDADAIAIYEEYKKMPMTAFQQLSADDIDAIIAFTSHADVLSGKPKAATGEAVKDTIAKPKSTAWMSYILLVVVFLLVLWVFFANKNEFIKLMTTIALLLAAGYISYAWMMNIGVDQGYKPIQPIAFSHKIHAGDNKIDCQYCHSNAKHSKLSGIPTTNVCMNCHKSISEYTGPGTDKEKAFYTDEIQKIYKAIGWDSENLTYIKGYKQQPIEWVRIHNLPDFAYYNHSQHVTVAGLKCQTCHGPVEEMDEVYQYSPLTMGWCIECHKKTEVKVESNEYYAKIHEEFSKKFGNKKLTVANMGGRECGKCHY